MMSKPLGRYLETSRRLNGIKPKQVAAAADTYPNILKKLISGDTEKPGFEMIRKLTKAVKGKWEDVWWIQEHRVDEATAQLLAEARYSAENNGVLTKEQRDVMMRMLADPEVAAAVLAAIGPRQNP
jgi:hypothetical protein